jgi:UPF0755 protein
MRRLLLALVALGLVLAAIGAWIVIGPNAGPGERGVFIPAGASFDQAVDSLVAAGVIQSAGTFRAFAGASGWGEQVKPGYYEFDDEASNFDVLGRLRRGEQTQIRVTIPPGTTMGRIARVVSAPFAFDSTAFREAARNPELLTDLGLEEDELIGVLLPETYFGFWLHSPETVIRKAYDAFRGVVGDGTDTLSPVEVATVASIVEWESQHRPERARIAGVYLNRLRIGMPLQADPTVQYGLLETEGARRRLLFVDYQLDHPYNTYRIAGLPPGPITNPSPSSLRAVLEPEEHDYLYFVAAPALDGTHEFSRTLSEHNRRADRYRAALRAFLAERS